MLDALISSKTRLKLLLRFFINPESKAYLRGLEQEFHENTNSIRVELNRFEDAGFIVSEKLGNKKMYKVNRNFPMYSELHALAIKHFGIDKIVENVLSKLGDVESVFLTGDLARGLDSNIVDLIIIGEKLDVVYLNTLIKKAEKKIQRRVRYILFNSIDEFTIDEPLLLIYASENKIQTNN